MTMLQDHFKNRTIDSSLVGQKDELLHIINHANCETLRSSIMAVGILKDFWISQSYGYKINEVLDRIQVSADRRESNLAPESKVERRELREIKKMIDQLRVPYELHTL